MAETIDFENLRDRLQNMYGGVYQRCEDYGGLLSVIFEISISDLADKYPDKREHIVGMHFGPDELQQMLREQVISSALIVIPKMVQEKLETDTQVTFCEDFSGFRFDGNTGTANLMLSFSIGDDLDEDNCDEF